MRVYVCVYVRAHAQVNVMNAYNLYEFKIHSGTLFLSYLEDFALEQKGSLASKHFLVQVPSKSPWTSMANHITESSSTHSDQIIV